MPRISLYRPEKTLDYEFIDKQILEMFTVGGTDINVHKFLGPKNTSEVNATADQPHYDAVKETNIQDMLFLENRDRKYDPDIYNMRAIYNVQDIDFDLSQFGLFLTNDTLFMTVHINSSVKTIGRKLMPGDVIELPHLKDEYALNDYTVALKRFYVIEDVNRAAEGFSMTWYPHLYRLKLKQIYDGQEFKEILDLPADADNQGTDTLRDLLSTYEKEMQINNAVVDQAEADAAKSGYDISHYYTLAANDDGSVALKTADSGEIEASGATSVDRQTDNPDRSGYQGYLLGTSDSPNGAPYGMGISFPTNNQEGDYFLRTDFLPKRLFKYNGNRWVKVQDDVRVTLTNTDARNTQKTGFINNPRESKIGGDNVKERQSLSKALRPKADN
tara:strand:- start:12161 stop:13321 length:1161 start_codon:yes stop_codon:yes gene_type:complete